MTEDRLTEIEKNLHYVVTAEEREEDIRWLITEVQYQRQLLAEHEQIFDQGNAENRRLNAEVKQLQIALIAHHLHDNVVNAEQGGPSCPTCSWTSHAR